MGTEERASLIDRIIATLRFTANEQKKPFCAGDTFFALAFKSDSELKTIAKLAGA